MTAIKKKQARREATEEKILDGFERVLLRDGAHRLSVVSISREAGVAKTLIYKYFGGLVGLIKTWLVERRRWPDLKDLYTNVQVPAYNDNPLLYQKQVLRQMAERLKESPLALEIMAGELLGSGPVTTALRELRLERMKEDSVILGHDLSSSEVQGKPTLRIFYAAIAYLVLRARQSPEYMGTLRLDEEDGWNEVMGDLEEIFDDLIAFNAQMSISEKRMSTRTQRS